LLRASSSWVRSNTIDLPEIGFGLLAAIGSVLRAKSICSKEFVSVRSDTPESRLVAPEQFLRLVNATQLRRAWDLQNYVPRLLVQDFVHERVIGRRVQNYFDLMFRDQLGNEIVSWFGNLHPGAAAYRLVP